MDTFMRFIDTNYGALFVFALFWAVMLGVIGLWNWTHDRWAREVIRTRLFLIRGDE